MVDHSTRTVTSPPQIGVVKCAELDGLTGLGLADDDGFELGHGMLPRTMAVP
jgi:hypothetical protein